MSKRPRDEATINSIKAILGDIPIQTIENLLHKANNNIETAINLYFTNPTSNDIEQRLAKTSLEGIKYYIGDLVITGWSLVKGNGLFKEGDAITIVRDKVGKSTHKIVRFAAKGKEVGRLPKEIASYMATLLDQNLCHFEGTIVWCPHNLKISEDMILSIQCYLLPGALHTTCFMSMPPSKKKFMSEKSTQNDLPVMRKLALLQMFKNLGLKPVRSAIQKLNVDTDGQDDSFDMIIQSITAKEEPLVDEKQSKDDNLDDPADENKEITDDQLNSIYEKAQVFDSQIKPMDPPDTMTLELKEYQKRALAWMTTKESNKFNSGDLDMRAMHPLWAEYSFPGEPSDEHRFFYFNPYSGELSLEFPEANKQELGGILADEMGLGKTIEILSLIHTNRYEIGKKPTTSLDSKMSPTTLIVCPMSLLAQWRDEILRASKPNSITVELFYGDDRSNLSVEQLCRWNGTAPDVLITTYGVVMTDWTKSQESNSQQPHKSPLFQVEFWRVVLDEAHQIKNRTSKTSMACRDIQAKRRWAVTGTPIQNKLDDLYSLVRFLHHEPWANHTFWKAFITVPFEKKDHRALFAVQNVLEPIVLRRTKAMRDSKGQPMVPLPPKTVHIEYLDFSREEQDIYNAIYSDSKIKFSYFCEAGKAGKNYASIFQLLTRLRQICCHPYLALQNKEAHHQQISANGKAMTLEELIAHKKNQQENSYGLNVLQNMLAHQKASSSESAVMSDECPICFETVDSMICMPCMHMTCRPCVMDYLQKKEDEGAPGECPVCRHGPIYQNDLLEIAQQKDSDDVRYEIQKAVGGFKRSTKINALVKHLKQHKIENRKTVVFSQFTSFLDLIGQGLNFESIEFTRLDGSQSQPQREKVLSDFSKQDGPNVLLISLRAGGIGLNLTCASRVILMDPWWNFAIESQAIDRIHRLGQSSEVVVTRFVMRDSVEERILAIQNRKHVLVNELYDNKNRKMEDLQLLFD